MNSILAFLSILLISSIIGNALSKILSEPLATDNSMDDINEKLKELESVMKHQEERIKELQTTVEKQNTLIQDMVRSKTIKGTYSVRRILAEYPY